MSALSSVAPGSVFARDYLVERPLAEGGMGAVYVVRQISTGRLRALKLMQRELVQNDDLRRRFLLEAKVGASIASEHVVEVQLAGVDEATGAPFLVMELLEGEDLAARLDRGPLPEALTRELFRQMCHALRLAHQAGIVHRDLKPPNVFLAKPKRAGTGADAIFHVKVLDFGIAKMTTDATVGAAKTGMIGTPLWMAPEQAEHVPVTPAADVWALGLILYTCVTGKSFWRTGNTDASMQQIMRETLFDGIPRAGVRAAEQGIAFPPALESVIARSVARRPQQRFRDAGAFFAALEDAFEGRAAPLSSPDSSGIELDAETMTGPSLELAATPSRNIVSVVSASAATLPPIMTPVPIPMGEVVRPRPLLADGWRAPWWLVYLVPLAIVAAFVGAAYSMMHPTEPVVSCRLCTVESGTFANGPFPLRQLRHDIEERFPELDARCIRDAKGSGRAKLKWAVEAGDVSRGTVLGGGRTGECLLDAIAGQHYAIVDDRGSILGRTDVTYIVEWNPSSDALSAPP